ncbi:unnamed protein product [Spodoptera littoralis]|uniref:Cytosolic fatty-acid binding proteins domain-containing protein n=1 Tax=Spodoptera littoralis TaxID=7109 RepID=A0A9P0I7T8_SPOLI|nr:unnamed protein product [Spodoptera littoralis]
MGGSPSDQKQTRAYGEIRSARASKSHQTTTDRTQQGRCRFGVAENLTGYRGVKIAISMSFFGKTYKFVKQENFDGFLKSAGMPEERVAKILEGKPEQKLTKDGDTYTLLTVSPVGTNEVKFKSGVEFDDVLGPEKKPVNQKYFYRSWKHSNTDD